MRRSTCPKIIGDRLKRDETQTDARIVRSRPGYGPTVVAIDIEVVPRCAGDGHTFDDVVGVEAQAELVWREMANDSQSIDCVLRRAKIIPVLTTLIRIPNPRHGAAGGACPAAAVGWTAIGCTEAVNVAWIAGSRTIPLSPESTKAAQ
jgi:hypothetical protein